MAPRRLKQLLPSSPRALAVPAVLAHIVFLAYSSQLLFVALDAPAPPSARELVLFNAWLGALVVCYARAVLTDPGRVGGVSGAAGAGRVERGDAGDEDGDEHEQYEEDVDGDEGIGVDESGSEEEEEEEFERRLGEGARLVVRRQRWCHSCERRKPPRSHHCRVCQRCIPKMDHHCPWTYNCVSHRTYPHFLRFIVYSVVAMVHLERMIWIRGAYLWSVRDNPFVGSHYDATPHSLSDTEHSQGPGAWQLAHLMILTMANSLTLLGLSLLLARTIWGLIFNITTIEDWEIDRHETLLRRAKASGGYLDGPDGLKVRIRRQEFPYDIGIWANIAQGMGTSNVLAWLWPFAATPSSESGLDFEANGLEDPAVGWPPPDPERIPRLARILSAPNSHARSNGSSSNMLSETPSAQLASFRARQAADLQRHALRKAATTGYSLSVPATRGPVAAAEATPTPSPVPAVRRRRGAPRRRLEDGAAASGGAGRDALGNGAETWRNDEGERLADFGLDERVEFYDQHDDVDEDEEEDEVPLAQLLRARRKG